ncbi:hypothetical protein G8O24_19670 [Bradyrhizobium sp. INPA01-394B]|uniref:Calcium-binding protein n=1 Tax=Bradyrhizobium campsiandrae TaxID=1729892 RepID=A0ABR7UJ15_9BRAD|nr:hypothetical protein [Bradyrhizobium campsiandrae]MBC9879564.1 hypothetical protein [Bradyrhizobium campsiandrae]MBC9984095.1 hypothetical protein [Bradyrhizobium campsiandrae]
MASDFFLKFDNFDQFLAHKLDHDFLKFGHDFDRVGDALTDLFSDALKFDEHKVAHDFKYDAEHAGFDFIKLGFDTLKLDDVLHKFDDVILKFADQTPGIGNLAETTGDGGAPRLSDDFIKLDTDFQAAGFEAIKLGLDTIKLHLSGEGANESFIKWAGDLSDFSNGLQKVGDDFHKVGEDFLKLGDFKGSEAIDQAFIKLGGGALKVSDDLHKVSDDFLKIATDIKGSQDNFGTLKIDQIALKFGEDFHKLDADLHKLNIDVGALGDDYIKLAGALTGHGGNQGGGTTTTSGDSDTLHQLLQHSHDFSLL